MDDLNAQLALLLGGSAALFADSSSASGSPAVHSSMDFDALSFLNAQVSPAFTPRDSFNDTPFLSGASTSPLDSMTIPSSDDLSSLDALLTPALSSLATSPDLPFSSTTSPLDLFPRDPSLSLMGNLDVAGVMHGMVAQAAARAQALAAVQMLVNATATPALPPPPAPAPSADLEFAAMLLNMVREKKADSPPTTLPPLSFPAPPAVPPVDPPLPPPIDPLTGLPMKVKKKVGRKKKIRPTDPDVIAAELARKRSKNTEAARRSRLKRMQKVDSLEERLKMLEDEREEFEKRIAELEDVKATLEARVQELEAGLDDDEE